jgi:hypothetical protein
MASIDSAGENRAGIGAAGFDRDGHRSARHQTAIKHAAEPLLLFLVSI